MKKILLFFIFAAGINSSMPLYAESESWGSLGFAYGNFFEVYHDGGGYIGSPGISFTAYRFFNGKRYGIFASGLVAFPVRGFAETNAIIAKTNYDDYLFKLQVGLLAGIGFRHDITERLIWRWGIGINFLMANLIYSETTFPLLGNIVYNKLATNWGIGGDVGFKFDVTDTFFWSIGGIFTLDFISTVEMDISYANNSSLNTSSSGWAKEYIMLSVRPYITLGLNLNLK